MSEMFFGAVSFNCGNPNNNIIEEVNKHLYERTEANGVFTMITDYIPNYSLQNWNVNKVSNWEQFSVNCPLVFRCMPLRFRVCYCADCSPLLCRI